MSKNNGHTIEQQLTNKLEITLAAVKIALKRILMDYEQEIQQHDPTFDVYNDIQNNLGEGYSEPTVRKWLNTTNNELPKLNQLTTISKYTKRRKAIDIAVEYLLKQAQGLN